MMLRLEAYFATRHERGAPMPGGRLTQEDRRRIAAWLAEGLSHAEIGRRLSRPTSTITREVNRTRGPAGYQADRAQRAARQRARRRNTAPVPAVAPADPRTDGRDPVAVAEFEERFTEALMQMGLPRMISRVLTCLTTKDSGSMTSAELVERLGVSAASISKAISFLEDQHLVRRERDGQRERYIVDDECGTGRRQPAAIRTTCSLRRPWTAPRYSARIPRRVLGSLIRAGSSSTSPRTSCATPSTGTP